MMHMYRDINLFNPLFVLFYQSKKICRRSAFFRHFGEPLQDCNGNSFFFPLSSFLYVVEPFQFLYDFFW